MRYLPLKRENIPAMIDEMNTLLCNFQIYYQKLRSFHWNVKGENFFELHDQFEKLYQNAQTNIDDIAERIRTLKYSPVSLLRRYLERAEIKEIDAFLNDQEMVKAILKDHAILSDSLYRTLEKAEMANDGATIHLLSGIQLALEKKSWMLDTWLSQPVSTLSEESTLAS